MAVNKKWSYGDFSHKTWKHLDPSEFNNSEIWGSAFGLRETPRADVFPNGMTGVTFIKCNLDNCLVPDGNTVGEGCCHKQHAIMNDGENWIVDKNDKPLEPLKKNRFQQYGLSIDPKDIPVIKRKEPITITKEREDIKLRRL